MLNNTNKTIFYNNCFFFMEIKILNKKILNNILVIE